MDVQVVASAAAGQTAIPAVPGQAAAAVALPGGADGQKPQSQAPLSPVVAKMFSQNGAPDPVNVNVSYRVENQPNMVVMVFTDPNTGQEISQVPAEVVVQLAQFFDKQSGVTLDKNA